MLKPALSYFDSMVYIYPEMKKTKRGIVDLTFQVTEDCNLKCSYCYQINKTHNRMSFETAKKIIDNIFDNKDDPDFYYSESKVQGFVIEFIGGEPFLEIDLIEQIIDYFEYKFLQYPESSWLMCHCYNFSTNGTLYMTPKVQKFLNKYRALIHVGVTVDGNKTLHDSCRLFPDGSGSYDLAVEATLSELVNYNYENTKITISADNAKYIYDGIINLIKLGFKYININCCFEKMWDKESSLAVFNELIKTSHWIIDNDLYDKIYIGMLYPSSYSPSSKRLMQTGWCGVGKGKMATVGYQGDIYPCIRFTPSSLGPNIEPIIIGDTEGFLHTQKQKNIFSQLEQCTREQLSDKECLECPIGAGCAWCLGYCYQETKDLKKKTNHICYPYKLAALACKYLCKLANDMENYNKINIDYSMYTDLLSIEEYNLYI